MALTVGYATRPLPGESVCGDCCGWWDAGERLVLAVADGLGHGQEAARAAEAALACVGDNLEQSCEDIFAACDARLQTTRGVALAVAIIEPASGRMTIGTVGNIRVLLLRESQELRLDGGRGIVGAGYKHLCPESMVLVPGDVLTMFSDGLDEFPELRGFFAEPGQFAQQQAQAILDQCAHNDDDASVLVYRYQT